jgi:hypothetical protein
MIERQVDITTTAGQMSTFVCHPERLGPHPVILFFMDAPGIREELRDMARRLATVGYYVLLPNLYYRSSVAELGPFIGDAGAAVREKMMGLMAGLTISMVMDDTDALIAFATWIRVSSAPSLRQRRGRTTLGTAFHPLCQRTASERASARLRRILTPPPWAALRSMKWAMREIFRTRCHRYMA